MNLAPDGITCRQCRAPERRGEEDDREMKQPHKQARLPILNSSAQSGPARQRRHETER
jgi:hypothetical protein